MSLGQRIEGKDYNYSILSLENDRLLATYDADRDRWRVDISVNGTYTASHFDRSVLNGDIPVGLLEFLHEEFPHLISHWESVIVPFLISTKMAELEEKAAKAGTEEVSEIKEAVPNAV